MSSTNTTTTPTMSSTNPTILVVPGSFAPPTIYKEIITHLRALNFPAVALELPSTMKRMPLEPATMKDDADVIRRAAETLLAQGKEVVVLCHSYGGTPTSEALVGLKVKRIVYLAAIVPKVGEHQCMAFSGEEKLPMETVGGYMHIDAVAMAAYVCNDLPWDLAYEHTLEFAHHSGPSMLEPVTQVAYADKDVPISYFLCEDDFVVQPDKQKRYIKVLEDAGKEVSVVSLKSGHCPMWSMPKELVDKLVGEVGKSG